MRRYSMLAAVAAITGVAAPAAAQTAYPYASPQQTYPQQYPQGYGQPGYGQPGYGYNQGYAQNPVGAIIDQLLGNRYTVTDRQAVSQCASAAMVQAQRQYRPGYGQGYGHGYGQGYNQGYNRGANLRVTAITDVQRRSNGLRVKGLIDTGIGYGGQQGYQNRGYANGDLSFRCNVDYRGAVTNVRISRNDSYRRY
jgi:hypothetical protein